MSFAITTAQVRARTKTVTRRLGWRTLRPGEAVNAVEKAMGLRKGETIKRLGCIRIVSTRWERLDTITTDDVAREGFPGMAPAAFVEMFCKTHKGATPETPVNRIEFEYI